MSAAANRTAISLPSAISLSTAGRSTRTVRSALVVLAYVAALMTPTVAAAHSPAPTVDVLVVYDLGFFPSPVGAAAFTGRAISGVLARVFGASAATGGLGKAIWEGHAFGKHVLKNGQFRDLGITTREAFARHIDDVVARAKGADVRQLSSGRTAYWDRASETVVIRIPSASDMGTAFRPTAGREYFENLK